MSRCCWSPILCVYHIHSPYFDTYGWQLEIIYVFDQQSFLYANRVPADIEALGISVKLRSRTSDLKRLKAGRKGAVVSRMPLTNY